MVWILNDTEGSEACIRDDGNTHIHVHAREPRGGETSHFPEKMGLLYRHETCSPQMAGIEEKLFLGLWGRGKWLTVGQVTV